MVIGTRAFVHMAFSTFCVYLISKISTDKLSLPVSLAYINMKLLISILLLSTSANAQNPQALLGNWRRITPSEKRKVIIGKQPQTGDLAINHDSTFYIWGDSANLKSNQVGEWVSSEEYKGTWKQTDNKHLTLFLDPKESKMFLPFRIVKLTKETLVLRFVFDKKKTKLSFLTYRRI